MHHETPLLQVEHHVGHRFQAACPPITTMADFPVDAEHTAQTTVGEEDRARAALAHQAVAGHEDGQRIVAGGLPVGGLERAEVARLLVVLEDDALIQRSGSAGIGCCVRTARH